MPSSNPISSVNDFVVRFANVNGSGSASANELFARSVLRMGVPVAPRNIFPSNIQGLPTWYEVRVSEAGHLGARGGTDLMVAMNPQTWDKDVAGIEPGGYLFYDCTKPLPKSKFRDDITVIGVPLTAICNREYTDPRQRQLFKNIIYVGALSALLDMDIKAIEQLVTEQFKSKEKLIGANVHALALGRDWALANLQCPIGLRLRRANAVGDRIFIEGNSAAALGAVYGGATVCAWYPITPSSSLADAFTAHCRRLRVDPQTKQNRVAIVQAEDELASIGIVIGAAWNGARAFTATSGPGISLMQEFLGLAYFAEIPAVVFDVQRAGPSTGMPTRTQQCDLISCAYASHGDTKHVLLFPEDPAEAFDFAASAFDLADRLQTPIFVMLDLDIGMNHRLCRPLTWDNNRKYDRGKVMTAADLDAGKDFGRYLDVDGDGIPYRTYPGTHPTKGSFFTRGTSRDRYARYTEEGAPYADNMQRLIRKFETAKDLVPRPLQANAGKPTKYGVIYYGSTSPAMDEAIHMIEARGLSLNRLRVRAFPFHSSVTSFVADHDFVFVVEQNRDAQLRSLIVNECGIDPIRLVPILHYDGTPITARFIARAIGDHLDALKVTPLRKVVSGSRPSSSAQRE
jgi:2-oxoglutarate/2-oxoacid ferredoxin oxidoreductase subunit alpha